MGTADFGWALRALKAGKRVAREGWNGSGVWLCLMDKTTIPEGMVNSRTRRFLPNGDLHVGAYVVAFTAQGVWQPGWMPWQEDMLAEDWIEVA